MSALRRKLVTAASAVASALIGSASGAAATANTPTFTEQVAPIIFQNCVSCHRPGEIGPFPLLTYQDVRKHGRQIAEVTGTRFMPPWHAESGHVEFLNPRVLSEEQIATLRRRHEVCCSACSWRR